jgi:hypothetical protein
MVNTGSFLRGTTLRILSHMLVLKKKLVLFWGQEQKRAETIFEMFYFEYLEVLSISRTHSVFQSLLQPGHLFTNECLFKNRKILREKQKS